MTLMPDPESAQVDPFFAQPTLAIFCDILDPGTGEPYNRDPRTTAKKAIAYLQSLGIGDTAYFGPEAEFFIFDDVRFSATPYNTGFKIDSAEFPTNSDVEYEGGNLGHRMRTKGGYFPVPPIDSAQDLRSDMLMYMAQMGVPVEKHHHEVASAQHELGMKFQTLVKACDSLQLYKYCIHQTAQAYGKTVTFMPKPIFGDNGSGMHVHQSIWKGGKPVFAGNKYADLSDECLYLYRRRAEAREGDQRLHQPDDQLLQAAGAGLRGAGAPRLFGAQPLRLLPHPGARSSPKAKRVEVRFPDPAREPLSRLHRDADGRPRRHQEQDPSGRRHGQGPLRPAAGGAEGDPDRLRVAPRSAWRGLEPTATSSRPAASSTTTRSIPTWR